MTAAHDVHQERDRGRSRWVCACGWATDWTTYTDPSAGAQAVRHQLDTNKEASP